MVATITSHHIIKSVWAPTSAIDFNQDVLLLGSMQFSLAEQVEEEQAVHAQNTLPGVDEVCFHQM